MDKVSIIIPTYNESSCIGDLLQSLQDLDPQPHEVIVVDGGSDDDTVEIVKAYKVRCIESEKLGRAAQLHLGAIQSSGDILCFLHADTFAPKDLVIVVEATLQNTSVALAGFRSIMKGAYNQRFTTVHNRIKTYYVPFIYSPYRTLFKGLRLLFGDQLMFCRKKDYLKGGGFNPQMMIMEEADLCIRMNRVGRIKQIGRKVYSSDRRVAKWGVFKSHVIFITIASLWAMGVSNRKLAKLYTHIR